MRKIHSYEWVGITVALVVVGFLVVEGAFGNLFNMHVPVDELTELAPNEKNVMDNQKPQNNNERIETDGLVIEILSEGSGVGVKAFDEVTVHYVGTLTDGTQFDSSVDRGVPFTFMIGQGQVIQGWEEGIMGMKMGEKRRLTIAPEKAYGVAPGHRLQNETLIFEVELLGIE